MFSARNLTRKGDNIGWGRNLSDFFKFSDFLWGLVTVKDRHLHVHEDQLDLSAMFGILGVGFLAIGASKDVEIEVEGQANALENLKGKFQKELRIVH